MYQQPTKRPEFCNNTAITISYLIAFLYLVWRFAAALFDYQIIDQEFMGFVVLAAIFAVPLMLITFPIVGTIVYVVQLFRNKPST